MSISRWCAGGCGTPNSASTSGSSAASAPHARSTANIRDGVASVRPLASSCQTRSGASVASSPDATIAAHQRLGFRRDFEAEARGEARDAKHAQRILGERRRHVAQHAGRKIALAAVRIDQRAVVVARHRVDREVAPGEVVLERDFGRREELEAAVAAPVLALGARERVFLVRVRMQEHREIATHRPVAGRDHDFGRRADDDPVAIGAAAAEQLVAHRAADAVDAHRLR